LKICANQHGLGLIIIFNFFAFSAVKIRFFAEFTLERSEGLSVTKKNAFLVIYLLTLFVYMLKYTYVSQQANINRQQAKMTFQFACRKLQRSKDLEPASPV